MWERRNLLLRSLEHTQIGKEQSSSTSGNTDQILWLMNVVDEGYWSASRTKGTPFHHCRTQTHLEHVEFCALDTCSETCDLTLDSSINFLDLESVN